jgi:radical SAM superfamily enzyme YgiQ (UPF0313 family)
MQNLDRTTSKAIHIVDDEFSLNTNRATEIAEMIRQRGLTPKLVYDCRARDILSEGFIESIADFTAGVLVGAECGYDEGLKVVGKCVTCQILEDAAKKLNQHGISELFQFSFIIGLPWETKKEVERTIRFAAHLLSTYNVAVIIQWYLQIPGSHLWQESREEELINEQMYDQYGFFRDLYLFRTGVHLKPTEIWEIDDLVKQLIWLANYRYSNRPMIHYEMPPQIEKGFPRSILSEENAGLHSLHEIHCKRLK